MRLRLGLVAVCLLGSVANAQAGGLVDRQACLSKGNTSSQCDCLVAEVERHVRAGVKPETYESMRKGQGGTASDDLTAMGVMIDATANAARACGVKLK